MKGSLLFLLSILLGVSLVAGQCPTFDRIFNYTVGMNLPWGFYETGIPNIILNEHNQVVRTDNEPGQRKQSSCPFSSVPTHPIASGGPQP